MIRELTDVSDSVNCVFHLSVYVCVCLCIHSYSCEVNFVRERGVVTCEVVAGCEVQKVVRFGFLLPRKLIKTCVCVSVCAVSYTHLTLPTIYSV